MVGHHSAKFGDHKYCSKKDVFSLSRDLTK